MYPYRRGNRLLTQITAVAFGLSILVSIKQFVEGRNVTFKALA